ncbi:efflux RND transporter periplasmic adaptor subunit [Succinivibrio dextrinosolvens]|uniref:efflux RND transporter periplasmic adaptor subunit n=1 Tax=Succinivibrio dextrinosolvens TaxID=83771 RepID=UPI0024204D13|nr:efflux RND transporter periplasmic adaptor subunit [Succinivibrio dextrinosolvens]MBE6423352.1 efflux RND transporter periplasmic adaptor subunit [Succinivibrio dextrinosolvens]
MTLVQEFPATVKGIQDVDIYPQVSGTVTEVKVSEGQAVTKDQELFIIDPIPYEAKLEKAKANVASAEAELSSARFNREAKVSLYTSKATSKYESVKADNACKVAEANLNLAKAELKVAQEDYNNTVVKSPVDGKLGMSSVRPGALVTANTTPLVSVSDNSYVHAYFSLTENIVLFLNKNTKLKEGEKEADFQIKFKLADGTMYDKLGEIDAESGIVDSTTGAITFRAKFPNPDGVIRSGGAGSVVIPVTLKDRIVIPQTATYEIQDKVFVFKFEDGKAVATPIQLLPFYDGTSYIVTEGLKIGDVIITEGAGLIRDGMPVTRKEESQAQAPAGEQTAVNK